MTTTIQLLTPPGRGAIAVLALRGPGAWAIAQSNFQSPGGKHLPAEVRPGFRFGYWGHGPREEIVLRLHSQSEFEIHCHGGPTVMNWIIQGCQAAGATIGGELPLPPGIIDPKAWALLPQAKTLKTAAILLDQARGAYLAALRAIEAGGPSAQGLQAELDSTKEIGQHLTKPWVIALTGPTNAGKSSLMNAFAGYQRSVVSDVPGTTRDTVQTVLSFDGWPMQVIDTAGLRSTADELERAGISRAQGVIAQADLCLWLIDSTEPPIDRAEIDRRLGAVPKRLLIAINKADASKIPGDYFPEAPRVSALKGQGITELIERIVKELIPNAPRPGAGMAYE